LRNSVCRVLLCVTVSSVDQGYEAFVVRWRMVTRRHTTRYQRAVLMDHIRLPNTMSLVAAVVSSIVVKRNSLPENPCHEIVRSEGRERVKRGRVRVRSTKERCPGDQNNTQPDHHHPQPRSNRGAVPQGTRQHVGVAVTFLPLVTTGCHWLSCPLMAITARRE
jgi:hypothetical protein